MDDQTTRNFTAIHSREGIAEFIKTGTYLNYLIISSLRLNKDWKIKVKGGCQKGDLKIKRSVVLRYVFDREVLRVQEVDGTTTNPWLKVEVTILICD